MGRERGPCDTRGQDTAAGLSEPGPGLPGHLGRPKTGKECPESSPGLALSEVGVHEGSQSSSGVHNCRKTEVLAVALV